MDPGGSSQYPPSCDVPMHKITLHTDWLFNRFADEYLIGQQEQVNNTRACPSSDACLAEAISTTLNIWFMSEFEGDEDGEETDTEEEDGGEGKTPEELEELELEL